MFEVFERFLFELGGARALPRSFWAPWVFEWRTMLALAARKRGDLRSAAGHLFGAWRVAPRRVNLLLRSIAWRWRSLWRRGVAPNNPNRESPLPHGDAT